MDNIRVQELLQRYYSLSVREIFRVNQGNLNQNYILSTGSDRYFLKIATPERISDVEIYTRAEKIMARNGIRVIAHLPTSDGQAFAKTDIGIFVLYPFVDAKTIKRLDVTPKIARSSGLFLAKFHRIWETLPETDRNLFEPEPDTLSIDIKKSQEKLRKVASSDELVNSTVSLKRLVLEKFGKNLNISSQSDALIHGDFQNENFFVENDEISYVFDLEKVRLASRYTDMARFIIFVCAADGFTERAKGLTRQFVDGYSSVKKIDTSSLVSHIQYILLKKICSTWAEQEYLKTRKPELKLLVEGDHGLLKSLDRIGLSIGSVPSFLLD